MLAVASAVLAPRSVVRVTLNAEGPAWLARNGANGRCSRTQDVRRWRSRGRALVDNPALVSVSARCASGRRLVSAIRRKRAKTGWRCLSVGGSSTRGRPNDGGVGELSPRVLGVEPR